MGAKVHPADADRIVRERGLVPLEPYPGAEVRWRCECEKCGREIARMLSVIKTGKTGCPYCARTRVHPDDAERILRNAGFEPLEPYPGSGPWRSRCGTCGRESSPTLPNVRKGTGCRYCGGTYIDADDALAAMRAAGLEPLEPYVNAKAPWKCECQICGQISTPTYDRISATLGGCGFCSHRSFLGKPACLYLVYEPDLDAVKVGIGRTRRRAARWARAGWVVIKEWDVDDGMIAMAAENSVLDWWRSDLNAPYGATALEVGAMGGHTETAPLWAVDLDETVARIEQLLRA